MNFGWLVIPTALMAFSPIVPTIIVSMEPIVSIVFTALNLTINAAQRGCGNTKISMRTNIVANIVNVIFNYLLINGVWIFPKWGVNSGKIRAVRTEILSDKRRGGDAKPIPKTK